MVKKLSLLFSAFLFSSSCFSQQSDSLAGFNMKEALEHAQLTGKKGKASLDFINVAKERFINRKYNLNSKTIAQSAIQKLSANSFPTSSICDSSNYGFEKGNTSGWVVTGASQIMSGTGVDTYGNFPVVYPGGNHSLRLSNDDVSTTSFTSTATRVIPVTSASSFFNLHFAMCILSYPHDSLSAGFVTIQFYDGAGTLIACPQYDCYYYYGAGGPHAIGSPNMQQTWGNNLTSPSTGPGINLGSEFLPVTYLPWQTVGLDLTSYIGQNVTCVISCAWCVYQYDWAYCYIDADCPTIATPANQTKCGTFPYGICGPTGMQTYSWTPPAGSVTTSSCITANTAGIYTLNTQPYASCTSFYKTYTFNVNQTPGLVVNSGLNNDSICVGQSAELSASGANTYSWSANAGSSFFDTITVSPSISTTYTLYGNSINGCSDSLTKTIYVDQKPVLVVNAGISNDSICSGQSIILNASGANTYSWSTNAGSSPTNTVIVSPTANTTYTLYGSSYIGCSDSLAKTIYVNQSPPILLNSSVNNDSICAGQSVTLSANGADTYVWSSNTGGSSYDTVTVSPGINTTYTLYGSSLNGCTDSLTKTIYVSACSTGIKNTFLKESVNIFPNPVTGILYIVFNNAFEDIVELRITNVIGEEIWNETLAANSRIQIDISELKTGIYFIQIKNSKGIIARKITVQH